MPKAVWSSAAIAAGIVALGISFAIRNVQFHLPNAAEETLATVSAIAALILAAINGYKAFMYFAHGTTWFGITKWTKVIEDESGKKLQVGPEHWAALIGVIVTIVIALVHSTALRVDLVAGLGLMLVAVGIKKFQGDVRLEGPVLGAWAIAFFAFIIALFIVGWVTLVLGWQRNNHAGLNEGIGDVLAVITILSAIEWSRRAH